MMVSSIPYRCFNEGVSAFGNLPAEILVNIFKNCSIHQLICQLARVSSHFRAIVHTMLQNDKTLVLLNNKAQQFGLSHYSSHRFLHSGKFALESFFDNVNEGWAMAAFVGDVDALERILGKDYANHKTDDERTVAHFAALGGQLPLLKLLVSKFGQQSITSHDFVGFVCLEFSLMQMHISTIRWLVTENNFSFFETKGLGGINAIQLIKENSMINCPRGKLYNHHVALIFARLLCHEAKSDGNESLAGESELQENCQSIDERELEDKILLTLQSFLQEEPETVLPKLKEYVCLRYEQMTDRQERSTAFLF